MTAIISTIHPTQLTYHEVGTQVNYHADNDEMFCHIGNATITAIRFDYCRYVLSLQKSSGDIITIPGTPDDGATVEILALTD